MRIFSLGAVLWLFATLPGLGTELLDESFDNERLHLRLRPPAGWFLANDGPIEGEPVEFWKDDANGPYIKIDSYPFELPDPSNLDDVQRELARALTSQNSDLDIVEEKSLTHNGDPAVEVMATLEIDNTYYHVIQRCLFARGRVYIMTCASFESTFLQDLPVFRAFLASVEILGEIYDPDAGLAKTGHLIKSHTAGVLALCLAVCGFTLRRISIVRMKRLGKWN